MSLINDSAKWLSRRKILDWCVLSIPGIKITEVYISSVIMKTKHKFSFFIFVITTYTRIITAVTFATVLTILAIRIQPNKKYWKRSKQVKSRGPRNWLLGDQLAIWVNYAKPQRGAWTTQGRFRFHEPQRTFSSPPKLWVKSATSASCSKG